MFCSNCGNKLPEGARFCSFCGARVAEMFEVPAAPEKPAESVQAAGEPKAAAEKPYEAALKRRVTFDWSNVIDEPQKKVVPDIKSPWATTGSIDEKELYAEMNAPSGRSRTMSFIDVLKAEKEEQAKQMPAPETDVRPIQYTEVLDPGYLNGETAPAEPEEVAPVLHYAPLYEDIDEPVVTPFDIPEEEAEQVPSAEVQIEAAEAVPEAFAEEPEVTPEAPAEAFVPSSEVSIEAEPAEETVPVELEPAAEASAPEEVSEPAGQGFGGWFELPDFLKPKEEKAEAAEVAVEEPEVPAEEVQIVEEPVFEEAVFEETEESVSAEEPEVTEEPVAYEDLITTPEEHVVYEELLTTPEEHVAYEELITTPEEQASHITYEELIMTPEEPAYFDELIMTPEEPAEIEVVEPVAAEPEPVAVEPEPAEELPEEAPEEIIYEAEQYSSTEDEYLNLNTERSSEPVRGAFVEDEYEEEDEESVDEEELFTEIEETAPKHTGMTIAAPADKESEIEALKKRLAELMGTSWEEPTAPAEEAPVEEALAEEPVEVVEEAAAEPEAAVPVEEAEPEIDLASLIVEEEPAEEPEAVSFEPELVLEEEEEDIEVPAPEISIEDAYLDIPEASAVSETRVEAAAEPELEIEEPAEEPEAVSFEPELVLEEEEEDIDEPVLVFDEPEVPAPAPKQEEAVAEAPAATAEEPEKPKTIDDFLADILREGAEEAPVVAAAEPVIESVFEEPEVPADEDLGVVLTAEDLIIAEPEEVAAAPEIFEETVVAEEPEEIPVPEVVAEPAEEASDFNIGLADLIVADEPVEEVIPAAEPADEIIEVAEAAEEAAEEVAEEPVVELFDIPAEPEAPAEEPVQKETDALSLEDLEKDLFGSAVPEGEIEATKKIDKFYTLYRKNEEFQRLLDEEYNKLKAAGGPAPEPAIPDEEPVSNKKIEDATIYQDFDLEKEAAKLREEQAKAEAAEAEAAEEAAKLAGAESSAAPVAAATAAAATGVAIATADKNEELEYEEYEKGGGFLTILAVIIAILLIVLLGIILVLNFMPESAIAFKIDSIIENITSHFTAVDVMGRQLLL